MVTFGQPPHVRDMQKLETRLEGPCCRPWGWPLPRNCVGRGGRGLEAVCWAPLRPGSSAAELALAPLAPLRHRSFLPALGPPCPHAPCCGQRWVPFLDRWESSRSPTPGVTVRANGLCCYGPGPCGDQAPMGIWGGGVYVYVLFQDRSAAVL